MNDFATPIGDNDVTYFQVQKGAFTLPAEAGDDGAKERTWKDKDTGETKSKWELRFKDMSGLISGAEFRDGNYGEVFTLELTNPYSAKIAQIQMPTNGKYFESFARLFKAIDLNKPVVMNAYDFENNDKKRVIGIAVKQDDVKILNHYYDPDKKVSKNGMIKVNEKEKEEMGTDYWTTYYTKVKVFLRNEIKSVEIPKVAVEPTEEEPSETPVTPEIVDEVFSDSADVME